MCVLGQLEECIKLHRDCLGEGLKAGEGTVQDGLVEEQM